MTVWGGVEAGGTKFICALATDTPEAALPQIVAQTRIPTTTPQENLTQVINFFAHHQAQGTQIAGLGIGSFGPIDVHPKPQWSHIDFVGPLKQKLQVPIGFDTDVNAAALGEYYWGQGKGLQTFLYLTIGTGIGGGGIIQGQLLHGLLHPEIGHMMVPQDLRQDPFPGVCPFHQNCLEGLASGEAIAQRWQCSAQDLPPDHPAWPLEAHYLALGLVNLIVCFSPQRLILGGGVMAQTQLFPLIQEQVKTRLNGYIQVPELLDYMETYIVPPGLGERSGILGAIALAQQTVQPGQ
jgi:fructokinase